MRPLDEGTKANAEWGVTGSALLPMRAVTLTERCYQQLHDAIITLELRPGTPLSELQLANRFGISKSPVREALQRLARDGLVTLAPNRRALVTGIDVDDVRDWYDLRVMLEPASLRRVVNGITPVTLKFLSDITHLAIDAVERHDPLEFIHNSDLFHLTLIDLNPNRSLQAVVHDLFNKIRRVRIAQYQEDALRDQKSITAEGLYHHRDIISALTTGDLDRSVQLLENDIQVFIHLLDRGELSDALKRVAFDQSGERSSPPQN